MESFNKDENFERNEKVLADRIEKLPTDVVLKADLIMAWKGFKKATEFSVGEKNMTDDQLKPKVEKLFLDLGLFYESYNPEEVETMGHMEEGYNLHYFVAKVKEDLEKLKSYPTISQNSERDKLLGSLYGFPSSAVNAFSKSDDSMLIDTTFKDLPDEIRRQEYMAFAGFRLSKDNWQEELKEVKKWAEEIKRLIPQTYKEIVEGYIKNQDYLEKHSFEYPSPDNLEESSNE